MKKLTKFLFLIIIVLLTYYIYKINNKINIIYLSLGDAYVKGITKEGVITKGYSDYIKYYLEKNKNLLLYSNEYVNKRKMIKDIELDIATDKEIKKDGKLYNIKTLLREADILTISIGLNDIILKYHSEKGINKYKEEKIVEETNKEFKSLMKEIKKYYHKKIYIVGYKKEDNQYDNLIEKLNNNYRIYAKINKDIYISPIFVEKSKKNITNIEFHKQIARIIVEKIKK